MRRARDIGLGAEGENGGGGCVFFFSSRRRHTIYWRDWSSDVCSSGLLGVVGAPAGLLLVGGLLPAEPGLERYRLAFCLLWTALATGLWLRDRQQPRHWPLWALTSSFPSAVFPGAGGAARVGPPASVLARLSPWPPPRGA